MKTEIDLCDCKIIHNDIIKKVKNKMPEDELLFDLSEFFKVFGDSTRIHILYALFKSEMCVCDIANLLNMKQSAISHQLRILKSFKLVKFRKAGKIVYYSLDDNHVEKIFEQGIEHIKEKGNYNDK